MNRGFIGFVLFIAIAALVGFFAASVYSPEYFAEANVLNRFFRLFSPQEGGMNAPAATSLPAASPYTPSVDYEERIINAVEKAAPGVIAIAISRDVPVIERCRGQFNPFGDLPPELRDFFGDFGPFESEGQCQKGTRKEEVGGGSGFIISSDGMVLTNKHVVADKNAEYTVLTNDGKKFPATVLARDPVQDLAVLKINPGGVSLPVLTLGDSDAVKLGQTVIAIGNALGEFRNTVSLGIISGLARNIVAGGGGVTEALEGVIQTDAAINPGNSGGPLLNLLGEVIGINTAVAQGAQNVGFALPINKAKRDIESVKRTGKITVPYLGVRYVMVTEDIAERDKLSVKEGALLRGTEEGPAVLRDSPAAQAGLQAEDIILEVNGEKLSTERSLGSVIQKYKVGDALRLKVRRGAETLTLSVTLKERKF